MAYSSIPNVERTVGRDKSISISDSRDPGSASQVHDTSPVKYIADSPTLGTTPQVNMTAIVHSSPTAFDANSIPKNPRSLQESPSRLTVHQNQMTSFGESFPADLVIPPRFQDKSNGSDSNDRTPTQADFPPPQKAMNNTSNGAAASPESSSMATQSLTQATPAGSTLRLVNLPKSNTPLSDLNCTTTTDGLGVSHVLNSPTKHFSFIEFGAVPSEELSLQSPMTPHEESSFEDRFSESDHPAYRIAHDEDENGAFDGSRKTSASFQPFSPSNMATASRHDGQFGDVPMFSNSHVRPREEAHDSRQYDPSQFYGIESSPDRSRLGKRQSLRASPAPNSANPSYSNSPARSFTVNENPGIESKTNATGKRKKRGSMFGLGGSLASQQSPDREVKPIAVERAKTDVQGMNDRGNPRGQSKAQTQHQRSKSQNILSRSATSGAATAEKGKKNRFSALGVSEAICTFMMTTDLSQSLFGRSGRKNSSLLTNVLSQSSPQQRQQQLPPPIQIQPQTYPPRKSSHAHTSPHDYTSQAQEQDQTTPYYNAQNDAPQQQFVYASEFAHQPPGGFYSPDRLDEEENDYSLTPTREHRVSSSFVPQAPFPTYLQSAQGPSPLYSQPTQIPSPASSHPPYQPPPHQRMSISQDRSIPSPTSPHPVTISPIRSHPTSQSVTKPPSPDPSPPPPPPKDIHPTSSSPISRSSRTNPHRASLQRPSQSPATATATPPSSHRTRHHPSNRTSTQQQPRSPSTSSTTTTTTTITKHTSILPPSSRNHNQPRSRNRQSLPALQTQIKTEASASTPSSARASHSAALMTPEELREARRREIEASGSNPNPISNNGKKERVRSPMSDKRTSVASRMRGAVEEEGPGAATNVRKEDEGEAMMVGNGKVEGGKEENEKTKDVDRGEEEEQKIVMSSTSYPGQEWRPELEYGGWDGD